MHPVILALTAAAEGQRPDDTLFASDAEGWLLLALGGGWDDELRLRHPAWGSQATRARAAALLPYATAALADVGASLSDAERSALEELDDAPLSTEQEFLLCAMGFGDVDDGGFYRLDAARERWASVLDALEAT